MVESMRKWNEAGRGWMLGVAKVGLVLAVAGTGVAQTAAMKSGPASAPKAAVVETAPGSGETAAKQGIKVSGWWTIQVKNPDGTVVERREFENSLQGTELLPALLLNFYTAGQPVILFSGDTLMCGNNPACSMTMVAGAPGSFGCLTTQGCSLNLTATPHYTPNTNGGLADGLTLAGSSTVSAAGQILFVTTGWRFCAHGQTLAKSGNFKSTTTPASCSAETPMGTDIMTTSAFTSFIFNGTGNQAPVHVNAGQIVQVSVVLSFS